MLSKSAMNRGVSTFAHLTHHQRRWVLLAMLGLLHLVLLEGVGSIMDRILMVIHIGLFFLWQPFVRTEQRLSARHLVMIVGLVAAPLVLQGTG